MSYSTFPGLTKTNAFSEKSYSFLELKRLIEKHIIYKSYNCINLLYNLWIGSRIAIQSSQECRTGQYFTDCRPNRSLYIHNVLDNWGSIFQLATKHSPGVDQCIGLSHSGNTPIHIHFGRLTTLCHYYWTGLAVIHYIWKDIRNHKLNQSFNE